MERSAQIGTDAVVEIKVVQGHIDVQVSMRIYEDANG